ncbi:MAG: hypothetical protein ACK4WH_02990 [Phycisphaerales bacterium]
MNLRTTLSAAAVCVCLFLAACEQKDLAAGFEKIASGMTLSQVENLMGSGNDETPAGGYGVGSGGMLDSKANPEKTYVWRDGGVSYTVVFKDGKVVQKSRAGQ